MCDVALHLKSMSGREPVMKRKPIIINKGLIIVLFLLSISSAFADVLPEDPTRGEQLLVSKGCVKCHAVSGEGSKIGPDLSKKELGNTPLDVAARLWNHTPSMILGMERIGMINPTLTGQEFNDISTSLYFLGFFDQRGNPEKGKAVFNEKCCRPCHPLTGKGRQGEPGVSDFPRNMSPIFLSKGIWNHGLDMVAHMAQIGMKWPKFRETEMMDLLEYIKTNAKGADDPAFFKPGNPKQGKQVFDTKGCSKCHSIGNELAKEGTDLGKMAHTFRAPLTQIASNMWNKGPTILVKMSQSQSGIPKFTSKEMVDLFAYLYFLPFTDEPGSILDGKRLFSDTGCSECHVPDTRRGKLLYIDHSKYRNTVNTVLVANIWKHNLEMNKTAREEPWPQFGTRQIADLLEFIRAPK